MTKPRVVYSSDRGRMCPVCGWPQDDCRCSKNLPAPVEAVPDEALLKWKPESLSQADFLKKENDPALKETGWEEKVVDG